MACICLGRYGLWSAMFQRQSVSHSVLRTWEPWAIADESYCCSYMFCWFFLSFCGEEYFLGPITFFVLVAWYSCITGCCDSIAHEEWTTSDVNLARGRCWKYRLSSDTLWHCCYVHGHAGMVTIALWRGPRDPPARP